MKIEAGAYVTPSVKLLRLLGEGGMGSVWVAQHEALGTEVAVKFLSGDYAEDPTARARFSREAAAASRVKSAHVVSIYDHGITDTNVPFIVMELLDGTDLATRIESEKKLSPAVITTIVAQLCKALERAHDAGVVHRDIKPENIFLGSEGGEIFVKLLDFGVAKTEQQLQQKTTGGRHSTMAGESLGTPFYMSPEQFKSSKDIDFRSDFWSVGVVVYEALTGQLPFVGETVSAVAIAVNDGIAKPPSEIDPALPKALDAWFSKACARQPADRFASARELSNGLREAFSLPIDSRASLPNIGDALSQSGRVIIRAPNQTMSQWSDETAQQAQPGLRDTAFATSSKAAPAARSRSWIAIAVIAVLAVGAAGLWLTRPPKTAAVGPKESAPNTTSASPAVSAALSASVPSPVVSATVASSSAAPASTKPSPAIIRPTPSVQPSAKPGHERDIW